MNPIFEQNNIAWGSPCCMPCIKVSFEGMGDSACEHRSLTGSCLCVTGDPARAAWAHEGAAGDVPDGGASANSHSACGEDDSPPGLCGPPRVICCIIGVSCACHVLRRHIGELHVQRHITCSAF